MGLNQVYIEEIIIDKWPLHRVDRIYVPIDT